MKYCRSCILPDTRPHLTLDAEGICDACTASRTKTVIDWPRRREMFLEVVANARHRSSGYDCLIPVSGGKDSTWQVVTCLEHGLRPLAVTWKTPARTEIGSRNLSNLIGLGVDHIDYQINPAVERRFMLETLSRAGSPAIPMHLAIFNIPLTFAVRLRIPLVIWGENSAFEYGGSEEERRGFQLDRRWLRTFGATQGTTAEDWIGSPLSKEALTAYFGPTEEELKSAGVLAVFLGYYFPWDPAATLSVALRHGFRRRNEGPKTGYYDFADIDDDFISIHHYLKWYKFGFTRLFDNLSLEIRNGRMTREDAIRIVREKGPQVPRADIDRFCGFTGITTERFFSIIEKFRNPAVWVLQGGKWVIPGFLIPDWEWS